MSYDMIDRFLRNNLGDDDYAKYSDALNALCTPQRTWVGLTSEELDEMFSKTLKGKKLVNWVAKAIEAKLREKNQ